VCLILLLKSSTHIVLLCSKQPTENLHRLLAAEERSRRDFARKASSRHSRFGTTIAVKLNPNKKPHPPNDEDRGNEANSEPSTSSQSFVLHRQQAISREAGSIMDMTKRQHSKKANTADELAREDNLSMEAKLILQNLAIEFVEACFNRKSSSNVCGNLS
jgi:replication fork protection complex subunit Tof1/Swi1